MMTFTIHVPTQYSSTSTTYILDVDAGRLVEEYSQESLLAKKKESGMSQISDGDGAKSTDIEDATGTPFHHKSDQKGRQFVCKGNDVAPFMPIETLKKDIFTHAKQTFSKRTGADNKIFEVTRLRVSGAAMWMNFWLITDSDTHNSVNDKAFQHRLLSFKNYVWNIHHYSMDISMEVISNNNVFDIAMMHLKDGSYYDFPKVLPDEMKDFFKAKGLYET